MTAIEGDHSQPIIEFGCGNGRDSIYFATHGFTVYGCNLSKDAIEKNVEKSKAVSSIQFKKVVDASSVDDVQGVVNTARSETSSQNVTIYTRFFLHSIDDEQQEKFFNALSNALVAGDKLYFEYRSKEDESLDRCMVRNICWLVLRNLGSMLTTVILERVWPSTSRKIRSLAVLF